MAIMAESILSGLTPQKLYPEGRALNPDFLVGPRRVLLSRTTPVTSIGSCFAREIRNYMLREGYNYLETARSEGRPSSPLGWNRVYNTFTLRQEVAGALATFSPHERFWELGGVIRDPYRKGVEYAAVEQAEREIEEHRRAARAALTQARLLIMTMGLREIWYSKSDGSVFAQVPPAGVYDPELHGFRATSVDENLSNLEAVHALLAAANPELQIVITVSPVPLRATFGDGNVVINNTISKSTLVVATHEFQARHPNVHYFPGYELVTVGIRKPYERDNRHVRRRVVNRIMQVFEKTFVAD